MNTKPVNDYEAEMIAYNNEIARRVRRRRGRTIYETAEIVIFLVGVALAVSIFAAITPDQMSGECDRAAVAMEGGAE